MNTESSGRERRQPGIIAFALMLGACGSGTPTAPGGTGGASAPSNSIGPSGGSISSAGGLVRIVVPSGALTSTVAISANAAATTPLDPWLVGGSAFDVGPSGTSFASPADLTIRYQTALRPSGTAGQDFRIHRLNGGAWETLGGTNDTAQSEATAQISSAGTYSVRWTGPEGPCSLAEDRQFDFWLGAWDLTDLTGGLRNPAGTNDITIGRSNCVIDEDYRSNVRGRSVSLYSRIDRRWHQTYIDSAGNRLVLIGVLEGNRMVLYVTGASRSVWEPMGRDTVRFVQEVSRDGGQSWTPTFDSRYTRR